MAILSVEEAVRYLLQLHYKSSRVQYLNEFRVLYGDTFADEVKRQVSLKFKLKKQILM